MILEATIGKDAGARSDLHGENAHVIRQPTLLAHARRDEPFLERPPPDECEGFDTEASS